MKAIIGSIKSEAMRLRKKGLSYNEISAELEVAKSTLSHWLKDIPGFEKIKENNIRQAKQIWSKNIIEFNKKRTAEHLKNRINDIEHYSKEIKRISQNNLFYLGIALYLAEGGKTEKSNLRFSNSDPAIIRIMIKFFEEFCAIDPADINARIHLYEHNRYKETLSYWSEVTGINKNKFWRPQLVITSSSKKTKPRRKLEYGTLHLTVCNANLNKKVYGWMKGIKLQFTVPD